MRRSKYRCGCKNANYWKFPAYRLPGGEIVCDGCEMEELE